MDLPAIGETITTARARALCVHFGYAYLVARIDAGPGRFKDWRFDGASMLPDELVAKVAGIPNLVEIALKHDLKYAYGAPGDEAERARADEGLKRDLLADGAAPLLAEAMYRAVRLGGSGKVIKTSFTWGFAWR